MERKNESVLSSGPQSSRRLHSGTSVSSTVFGFQLSENQFQILNRQIRQCNIFKVNRADMKRGLQTPGQPDNGDGQPEELQITETKTEEASLATVYYRSAQGTDAVEMF